MQEQFLKLSPTAWVAILTVVLAVVAILQVVVYFQMRDHQMVIERAYVALTHVPPGIFVASERGATLEITTQAKITNHGNSPAQIHDAAVTYLVTDQPLPTLPDYERNEPKRAGFLVKGDTLVFHGSVELSRLHWDAIQHRHKTLYVFGYCEYSDFFGNRHRSGYGRFFDPDVDRHENYMWRGPFGLANPPLLNEEAFKNRSNLKFITLENYNYNREIDEQGRPANPEDQP